MKETEANVESLTLEVLRSIRAELGAFRNDVNSRFAELNSKFDGLNSKFDGLNSKVDGLNSKVDGLREDMNVGFKALFQLGDRRFVDHEGRLRRIEHHLGFE